LCGWVWVRACVRPSVRLSVCLFREGGMRNMSRYWRLGDSEVTLVEGAYDMDIGYKKMLFCYIIMLYH
jgi:hypothetical protein